MAQTSTPASFPTHDGLSYRLNEIRRHYKEWEKVVSMLESELPVHPQPTIFSNWLPFPGTRPSLPCPWILDEQQEEMNQEEVSVSHYGEFCTPRLEIDARIHRDKLTLDLAKLGTTRRQSKRLKHLHQRSVSERLPRLEKTEKEGSSQRSSHSQLSNFSARSYHSVDDNFQFGPDRQERIERKLALKNGFIRKGSVSGISTVSDRSTTSSRSSAGSVAESISTASLKRFYARLPPMDYGRSSAQSGTVSIPVAQEENEHDEEGEKENKEGQKEERGNKEDTGGVKDEEVIV